MAQRQHDHEPGTRLSGRDIIVALTVALMLVAGWLWHDWTRGALDVDVLVAGVLFLATILVGMRCLDLVIAALASHYRLRRRLERFDREANDLHRRLERIDQP
jgi:hypothetical protein